MTRAEARERTDIVWMVIAGGIAMVAIAAEGSARFARTFTPAGIAWSFPIEETEVAAAITADGEPVSGAATALTVHVTDVNVVSAVSIGASLVLQVLIALAIIGLVLSLGAVFLRGRFFVPATARLIDAIALVLAFGTIVVLGLDTFGRNGVLAALGQGEGEPLHPATFWSYAPVWFAALAIGVLGVAFRRGLRLQRDTEGLV